MTTYNLTQMTHISYSGFNFTIPEDTYDMINYLCSQLGTAGIKSAVFVKSPLHEYAVSSSASASASSSSSSASASSASFASAKKIKRRGNKGMEEPESFRNFQPTIIETKTGIDAHINELRLYLNKLTDKTFLDMRAKIMDKINSICAITSDQEDIVKMGATLYGLCSTNKFYSKIFADLFAELAAMYDWLNTIFQENYACIMDQYIHIKYIDSNQDYDGFCEMNKTNEKRRAVTTFYFNLAMNGFISKESLVSILSNILTTVVNLINVPEKKNEVDELTEIVGILFNKEMIECVNTSTSTSNVMGATLVDTVSSLAQKKAKDYPSLSNKAIFKYMDLVEM